MIEVTDSRGRKTYVHPGAVAHITEASVSSQWHGIRSYVTLFDGATLESDKDARALAQENSAGSKTVVQEAEDVARWLDGHSLLEEAEKVRSIYAGVK
jgi:hypothetical protein